MVGDELSNHRKILIDTNVWLYHLGAHPEYGGPASNLLGAVEQGKFEAVVSELTLMELQVWPLQLKRQDIADKYELLLDHFPHLNPRLMRAMAAPTTFLNLPMSNVHHVLDIFSMLVVAVPDTDAIR